MMLTKVILAAMTLGGPACGRPPEIDHHLRGVSRPGRWAPRLLIREQRPCSNNRAHPVLYIHGATFPSASSVMFRFEGRSWADDLNGLGFNVFGLDFAGYGGSERYASMASTKPMAGAPEGRSEVAEKQIERAVRFILSTTGAKRVSVVAHSWGTMAAGRFAATHPSLIDRLVLFGPIARREGPAASADMPWDTVTIDEQHTRFVKDVPKTAAQVLLEADFPRWASTYLLSDPGSGSRSPPAVAVPSGPAADVAAAWSGSFPYDMSGIKAPVLLIRGEWDSSSTDADAAWLQGQLVNAASVRIAVIPKATHLMHLETGRDGLYAATGAFLVAGLARTKSD